MSTKMQRLVWPTGSQFAEAIQNPRISFSDPDLRNCTPAVDRFGMPTVSSGQFAFVFKLNQNGNGGAQAVRCFRGDLGDREQRYRAIDAYLNEVSIPYFANFEYDADGILVEGRRYPILTMEWIEGPTLDLYVAGILSSQSDLERMADQWIKIVSGLQKSSIAHGDLQHGNIIVTDGITKLVDLDGMFVPQMKGWSASELGHIHYQHPRRTNKHFGQQLDNFSALVIYLSLISLAKLPDLWSKYHDENLVFRNSDFKSPNESSLFKEIRSIGGKHKELASVLMEACSATDPLKCPPLTQLVESKSKLPAWMDSQPKVTVAHQTREVRAGGNVPPPVANKYRTEIISGSGLNPSAPASATSQPGNLSTATGTSSTPNKSRGRDLIWPASRHAVNYAFVGVLLPWLWYPILSTVYGAFGVTGQGTGILAIATYLAAAFYGGYQQAKRSARSAPGSYAAGQFQHPTILTTQPKPTATSSKVPSPSPSTGPIFQHPTIVASQKAATSAINAPSPTSAPSTFQHPTILAPSTSSRATSSSSTTARPVAPSRQPQSSSVYGSFVGNRVSMVFHRSYCQWAVKISSRNRQSFGSAAEAQTRGYRACRVCAS